MSYLALATTRFDEVITFYRDHLGFPVLRTWDRPTARGSLFDLCGMRLEILDACREREPMRLPEPGDRVHLVIELTNVDAFYQSLKVLAPEPRTMSWGARSFSLNDPDGVKLTFLQWLTA